MRGWRLPRVQDFPWIVEGSGTVPNLGRSGRDRVIQRAEQN